MTRTQRILIALYALLLTGICLWVPWKGWDRFGKGPISLPYGFLWSGPRLPDWMTYQRRFQNRTEIDLARVGLEAVALTAVFGAAYALNAGRVTDH
jgi:hypothetical protein